MTLYRLDRLAITGPITESTPGCVILEIAGSRGFCVNIHSPTPEYINKCVCKLMQKSPAPQVDLTEIDLHSPHYAEHPKHDLLQPFNKRHHLLELIARYVNNTTQLKWKCDVLLKAFHHLYQFTKHKVIPNTHFVVGQKTNEFPMAYNACMMYALCNYYTIPTSRQTTLDQMAKAVRYLQQDPEDLRHSLTELIANLSRDKLVRILLLPDLLTEAVSPKCSTALDEVKDPLTTTTLPGDIREIDINEIKVSHDRFNELEHILPRVVPTTHAEATILAAMVYGINIADARNPYLEYARLMSRSVYIPKDPKFRCRYLRCPSWFQVKTTWSWKVDCIYDHDNRCVFARAEGYTQIDDPLLLLQTARVTPTFYLGLHPDCCAIETVVYQETVNTLHPQHFVTYGISEKPETLVVYTLHELIDTFHAYEAYLNPCNLKEVLPEVSIRKLRLLTVPPYDGTETDELYHRLREVMAEVDVKAVNVSAMADQLYQYYIESGEDVTTFLTLLLDLAYYMRGWKVSTDLPPIEVGRTQFMPERQGEVDVNTTTAFAALEGYLDQSVLGNFFESLPLMTAKVGDAITFVAMTDHAQGLTIRERLDIVKAGVSSYACIRLSSNHLAMTAYYYMRSCRLLAPFDITKLAKIS